MIRKVARVLGLVMIGNAGFDFLFPGAGIRFITEGPGRKWKFPGRGIVENFSCLSAESRRFLAAWEGGIGALLYVVATIPLVGQAGGYGQPIAPGPVRIPIQHIR